MTGKWVVRMARKRDGSLYTYRVWNVFNPEGSRAARHHHAGSRALARGARPNNRYCLLGHFRYRLSQRKQPTRGVPQ
ncbi:hypothetical protein I5H27_gp078 [Mycobacterium phage DillTech15]|uniref:Uncharacterized protein n=1 Tax=Mycobacterium phage DillTech15 TaxID=2163591 RepID=A0A2S1PB80_9CAUD|nr:hypothetical protein I5H27_gp078 [Mycobacterium phage DillTech15]AWH13812.1 hypothetical protein SEA_DILLTECH15_78 [Mycobacterium phage DillTech15]